MDDCHEDGILKTDVKDGAAVPPAFSGRLLVLLWFALAFAGCTTEEPKQATSPADVRRPTELRPSVQPIREVQFEQQLIADGLHTPAGIAIQPGTGDIFISTLEGILRLDADLDFVRSTEISGFGQDAYGRGPRYCFGPLGLGFIDGSTLAVGGGGQNDGVDVIRFYEVGAEPKSEAVDAAAASREFGPITQGEYSHRGEGNFFALLIAENSLLVGSHGDDSKGWVSRIGLDDVAGASLVPFIPVKQSTDVDGPSGLAILPDRRLAVALTGELHERPDSVLAIYDPESGQFIQAIATGLHDITSILIHPDTGRLYALDFAWAQPAEGGLYSLDVDYNRGEIEVTKHVTLQHPSAMALAPDGSLMVTCVADQDEQSEARGTIYRITIDE